MDDRRFDLTYRLEPADYRAMMAAYWHQTPGRKWRVRALKAIPIIALPLILFFAWRMRDPAFLGAAVVLFLLLPIIPRIDRYFYDRAFHRLRIGEGDVSLTADGNGVKTSGTIGSSQFPWSSFQNIEKLDQHILLWLNPYQALIVPRRSFSAAVDAERFAALAKSTTRDPAP